APGAPGGPHATPGGGRSRAAGGDSPAGFAASITPAGAAALHLDLASAGLRLNADDLRARNVAAGRSLVLLLRVGTAEHRELRAVRELRRILGPSLGAVPPPGRMRETWCDVLQERMPELVAAAKKQRPAAAAAAPASVPEAAPEPAPGVPFEAGE
ncbi:MAG: hypothetical protein P1V81_10255, partial [Planctomycetota bacterium]|nr:hypothetical protein [Planctomycetota bacterium]